jgi:hypothetical protein
MSIIWECGELRGVWLKCAVSFCCYGKNEKNEKKQKY